MYIRSVVKRLQSYTVTVGDETSPRSLGENPCESGHKRVRLDVESGGSKKNAIADGWELPAEPGRIP